MHGDLETNNIVAFGTQALFSGFDASGNKELWVTNGTLAGTSELTNTPNTDGYDAYPFDITVFGTQAVFNGVNTNGNHSLWVTNGTLAGTHELTGIVNANSMDFNPSNMAVLVSGSSPLPTPTPSPTPVSTSPSLTEYLQASDAAYGLDKNAFVLPPGMTYITESPTAQRAQGFEAVALQDTAGNIIIANEGTVPGPIIGTWTPYENGCLITDIAIGANYPPAALTEAIAFATSIVQMEKQQGSRSKIYVTGHSLGGIEAEAEAQALQTAIAGGATFGASGLPHNTTVNVPTTFMNYIDVGDPIGDYASDAKSALSSLAPANMNHYGHVQLEGVATNASYIQDALLTKKVLSSDLIKALEAVGKLSPATKAFFTSCNATMYASIGVYLGASVSKYHVIRHYAADLQVNLTPIATVAPAISLDEYLKMYDPQLSITDIKDAEAANVSSNGTLISPEMTISFAPQKELITSETYMAPDSSVYNATMNASEAVTVVQVNQSTGGSYQAVYDTANRQTWSSYTNFYKGANETGMLTEAIYNWKVGGGSQVRLFTGLPRGVTEEIKNYRGPNGTGTLLSTQFK